MSNRLFDATTRCQTRQCVGQTDRSARRHALCAILLWLSLVPLAGCSSKSHLMPAPTVYTHRDWNPFADVPPALHGDDSGRPPGVSGGGFRVVPDECPAAEWTPAQPVRKD